MIRKASEMREQVRENMRGGAGAALIRHCFEKDEMTANCRLCSVLTLKPGAGIGMHRHENEDEVFIVIRGTGVMDDGKTRTRVSAGDATLTGKGEGHAVHNDGDEDLVIAAIIMGYSGA